MSLFPDLPPPASPSAKPKLTPEERRDRQADRLTTIRLRMLIGREQAEAERNHEGPDRSPGDAAGWAGRSAARATAAGCR
jgi:hypothetical protein